MRSSRVLACAGRGRRAAGRGDRARAPRDPSLAEGRRAPTRHRAQSRARSRRRGRARAGRARGTAEATGAARTSWRRLCSRRGNDSRGVVWSVANREPRHVNTSEPRESALLEIRDPNARKSDFHQVANGTGVESTRGERSRRRVRSPETHERRHTPGDARGPRRDEIPSRPGRSRCRDSRMGLDLGVTGRAAVGSAGPPRRRRKRFATSSQRRPTEHLRAVRHRREAGVDAGVEGRGTNAADRDAHERAGHGEGDGRGSAKGGGGERRP